MGPGDLQFYRYPGCFCGGGSSPHGGEEGSRRQVCAVSFPSDSVLSKLRGVCREVGGGAERVSARTVLYKELSPVVLIQGQLGSQEIFSNV